MKTETANGKWTMDSGKWNMKNAKKKEHENWKT